MTSTFNISADSYACGQGSKTTIVSYLYAENSIVFSVKKANRGILYPVAIKSVRLINNKLTYGKTVALYTDTFNTLWNEYDLCPENTAVAFAISYWETLKNETLEAMTECSVNQ